jgi:mRNA interferase HicA
MSYVWWVMKGSEFLRAITKLGRRRGVSVSFDRRHGKGSHGTLRYGSRKTTLKYLKQEIGEDLLRAMLTQLGLTRSDLE